ncbi:MAG: glycosyltransferase family 9 protein [Gemmatimonadaceae bacterium]
MRILPALQAIEEAARRALFTSLMRRTTRGRTGHSNERPSLRNRPFRVLVIMEDAIGDMVLSLPAIRAIAESHAHSVVDVVTWPIPAQMLEGASYIRNTIVFPRGDHRRLHAANAIRKHGPYDVVVDGMVLCRHVRSRSFAMMLASGAHTWIGEDDRGSDYLLSVTVPRAEAPVTHLARMLSLATPFYEVPLSPSRPQLAVSDEERSSAARLWGHARSGPRILVNVSTNGSERQWPREAFREVVRHIRKRSVVANVIVIGMERDRVLAEFVAEGAVRVVMPNIRELLSLIESAELVVSPDTSVCHMASAFLRPLVSIHNSQKAQWLPFDTPGVRVIGPAPEDLSLVTLDRVCAAIEDTFDLIGFEAAGQQLAV